MLAEESGKLATAFSQCHSRRDLDAILEKAAASRNVAIDPDQESYFEIGTKLGLTSDPILHESFREVVSRLHLLRF